jgi:peptide/nickel transport system permease protein
VQFGNLLGGTVIMEQIFTLPGVGGLTLSAVVQRDYPQLQANILFLATAYLVLNLVVDVAYGWLDPRIRYA